MEKGAVISKCQNYRYALWRTWDSSKPIITFVGLNPSTADHECDDPTIKRCINFAKSWGAGGIYMVNLFAYRATRPEDMIQQDDPIGAENDHYLQVVLEKSEKIIACWGNWGIHQSRSDRVKNLLLEKLYYFELNKTGEPKHPLYVHAETKIKKF